MYTDAQLNTKTKPQLVELSAELQNQLLSAQSGPLKSSDIEKKILDLKRQADVVADNAIKREQTHKEALAKINSDTQLAKQKLELEFKSEEGNEAVNLKKVYEELEAAAIKSMDDLSFGLKQAEIDTQVKVDDLNEKLATVVEQYDLEVESWKEKVVLAKESAQNEITSLGVSHKREIEQTRYENKIALRDENLEAAEKIAKIHDKTLIDIDELEAYEEAEKVEEAEIKALVEEAVKAAKSEVFAAEGAKFGKLSADSKSEIALLTKDKEYLTNSLLDANKRIAELTLQIKDFPAQIATAVEAAKSNIAVNQDNKK